MSAVLGEAVKAGASTVVLNTSEATDAVSWSFLCGGGVDQQKRTNTARK